MQKAILTKLSKWEYENGDTLFSRQKSSRVSRLVRCGTPARFLAYVYSACQRARAKMSQSPSKYVTHTRGNRLHLVTWIMTITPRWQYRQYDTNMHLQQSPQAHTHATRSRALMAREDDSCNHESSSYKVHNHPQAQAHTHTHTHTHIHTHTYTCRHSILHSWFNQGRWLEWPSLYPKKNHSRITCIILFLHHMHQFVLVLYVLIHSLHIIKMILRF